MFGKIEHRKPPMQFVVAFSIDDDTTKGLMTRAVESGYTPEQIARYALRRYLNELSHTQG